MKKMILITNLYPSEKYPYYGTFVKKFNDMATPFFDIKLVALYKEGNKLMKLLKYFAFYMKIIVYILFSDSDSLIYVHYASHTAIPILLCNKIKKFTLYVNVHGSDIFPAKKNENLQKYTKRLLFISDRIVVPSSYFEKAVKEKYNLFNHDFKVFPSCGVDSNIFYVKDKKKIMKENNLSIEFKYIGFASRFDEGKGVDILLKSINELNNKNSEFFKDKRVILIGSGKYDNEVSQFIKNNSLEKIIIRYPQLNQKQLSNIYNILDWFVFPTIRKGESLGLVGLEAMACGIPVIASNFAGPSTYIIHKVNGLFFEVNNYNDLSSKIFDAFNLTKDEYMHMKNEALITSKKYLDKNLLTQFLDIFEN